MDANITLANYVVNTTFDDIPAELVELAKKDIMDTLGVAIAAGGEAGGKELMELIDGWGGKPESTVIGYGKKVPAHMAAMVNSTTAHSLDYDDVMFSTGHVGVTVIPPALAAAELRGNVSGKELITAVVLGIDVMCRLGEASEPLALGPGWLYTPLYGVFGATAAAGKILGLTADQMANAFGIAYSQAAGNRQPVMEGALVKRIQAGMATRAGVFSALAAAKGVTGASNCFEGKFGLFNVYHRGKYMPENLTRDLGKYFAISKLVFKKFPACSATEASAEAAAELAQEYDLNFEDVKEVAVRVGMYSRNCAEPLEKKQNPQSDAEAQFSVPWVAATALVKKRFTIEDVGPEELTNQNIRELAKKIQVSVDMEVSDKIASFPAIVEVKTKDEKVYTKRVDVAKGHPDKPMSLQELTDKFRECGKFAKKPLDDKTIDTLVETLLHLEGVADVGTIMEKLA